MAEYVQGDNHFVNAEKIMREVLREEYWETPSRLDYQILRVNSVGNERKILCSLQLGEEIFEINQQKAEGTLDAFSRGLKAVLFEKYFSLKSLSMVSFELKSSGTQTSSRPSSNEQEMDECRFDMKAELSLTLKNVKGGEFTFKTTGFDFVQSSLLLTLEAFLFFVNSERAFRKARTRYSLGTSDADYIRDVVLPVLAKNNDYRKIAEQIDLENKPK